MNIDPSTPSTTLACELGTIADLHVRRDEPLARHTPLRLGGPAELWAVADTVAALQASLQAARRNRAPWRVHWPFADWMVREGGVRGLVLRPGREFEAIDPRDGGIYLGSAALWSALSGAPGALGPLGAWPGSVGGLFAAGEQGRLAGLCTSVRWLRGRGIEQLAVAPGEPPPAVPDSAVLLGITLAFEPVLPRGKRRGSAQAPPPAGALFTPPPGDRAERLLSRSGLCGARLRDWRISEQGTAIQLGHGTCRELLHLAQGLQERVQRERGVALETRLPVVGSEATG